MFLRRSLLLLAIALLFGGCSSFHRFGKNPDPGTPTKTSTEPPDAGVHLIASEGKGIDVDFLLNYYDQDGDHSPVTGGIGTEDLQVLAPTVLVSWAQSEKWTLAADLGLDAITSASTDNIDIDTLQVSSASRQDARGHAVFTASRSWEDQRLSFGLGFSSEYDYFSLNGHLRWSKDFNQNNTTFTVGLGLYSDTVDLYNIDGILEGEDDRQTLDLSLSLTHNLGPSTVGSLELALSSQSGFLSTPYQEVILAPTAEFPEGRHVAERLPDSRERIAVALSLQHAFTPKVVQRFYVRFYDDDFGIQAQTVELETHFRIPLAQEGWIFPILRFHSQTASDYFGLPGTFTSSDAFFTADRDLSEFDSQKYGLGLRILYARNRAGWRRHLRGFETRVTTYSRDDGLDALSASFAWRLRF